MLTFLLNLLANETFMQQVELLAPMRGPCCHIRRGTSLRSFRMFAAARAGSEVRGPTRGRNSHRG